MTMTTTKRPLSLIACALALAAALQGQTGEGDDAAGEVFFDRLDVNVVNVEVFVTDKSGASVAGLTAADFEILEDGRPQQITNFYAVENGRPRSSGTVTAAAPAAGTGEPAPPGIPPELPPEQALRLVVFFDNLHLRPATRNKVVRRVFGFVSRVLGDDGMVMLATFDKSLHVRHPFTRDLDAFRQKLDEIELTTGWAMRADTERRDVIRRVEQSETALEAESHVDFYAKSTHYDVTQAVAGLQELVGSLAGLPGRKALLYVSDGIPMTAAEDLFHLLDLKFPNHLSGKLLATQYRARRRFRELTASANANGVTLYTLEASGLRSHTTLSAEYGALGDRSFVEIDGMRDFSLEEPLMMMAADTGGLAALNTNNLDGAFADVAADLGNYYSLGYAPAHAVAGRYHSIEVRVKRRGLKVRHRTGYRDKTPATRVREGTLATLLYGAQANPLAVQLRFAAARATGDDGERLVPLEVRIPLGRVALMPRGEAHHAQLRVAVAVIDDDGRMSPVDQKEFPVTIPAAEVETARQQYYVYAVELRMRPGDHRIAVGVHDDFSGETSFIRQSVRTGT